jgi:hypothetical protein
VAVEEGVPDIVGAEFGSGSTVTVNEERLALSTPSLTDMVILDVVPVSLGVPLNSPVELFSDSQDGRPVAENVNGSLSASLAVGVKE